MRAVIAHCWTGSPAAGWYPAAAAALHAIGYDTLVPALPNPDAPTRSAWVEAIATAVGPTPKEVLLVGHSLGALAALHWLGNAPAALHLAGLFLVAPPLQATGIPEVDGFLAPAPDLDAASKKVGRSAVLVSDADIYLKPDPLSVAQSLAQKGFETIVAPGKGHFSPASGLTSLPELTVWATRLTRHAH